MTRKNKVEKPRGARSLSVTLAIAFFTLSVVMLLVYSTFALFTNIRTYQESISVQQLLIAKEASKAVSNFVEDKIGSLEATVELVDLDTASADQKKTALDSLLGLQPAFRQLALLNKMGRELAWTSRISPALTKQFTTQYQTETLILTQTENGQRYISSVYIDEVTSEPLVLLSIPVTNVLGDFQGTLVAELNLKFMWDLVDQLKVGETGYAYVVDNQGNLIAYRDTSRVLRGENVHQIKEVQKFIENPTASSDRTQETVPYTGLTGKTVVGSYVSLGTPQWAVLTELPTTEAYSYIFQVAIEEIQDLGHLRFLDFNIGQHRIDTIPVDVFIQEGIDAGAAAVVPGADDDLLRIAKGQEAAQCAIRGAGTER